MVEPFFLPTKAPSTGISAYKSTLLIRRTSVGSHDMNDYVANYSNASAANSSAVLSTLIVKLSLPNGLQDESYSKHCIARDQNPTEQYHSGSCKD